MRRRWLLLSLTVLAGAPEAMAQEQSRRLSPGEVLRGHFTQERHLKGFDRPLISVGDFVLAPGLGLIWRTERPFVVITVITAGGLVQEVNGTETTRMATSRLPFLARLYDLLGAALSGDFQALNTLFQVTRHGDAGRWDLELAPRAGADPAAMPFRSIALRGGQYVDEARIERGDDDFDRLVFSDQTLGSVLSGPEAARLRAARK